MAERKWQAKMLLFAADTFLRTLVALWSVDAHPSIGLPYL